MAHPDILTLYEEGLQESEEEEQQTNQEQQPPNNTVKQSPPPSKGKGKMAPMKRQTLDPLRQLRQKQEAGTKLLAAQ